jgi:hypothetical protein
MLDFSNTKRAVTWITSAIAVLALVVFWTPLVYRAATGGNVICGPFGGPCWDRFCLFFYAGFQTLITIGLAGCLWACSTLETTEERDRCGYICWIYFQAMSIIIFTLAVLTCAVRS